MGGIETVHRQPLIIGFEEKQSFIDGFLRKKIPCHTINPKLQLPIMPPRTRIHISLEIKKIREFTNASFTVL